MRYEAALEKLQDLSRFGVRLGLQRMQAVLQRLNQPQQRFPSVHLAGTNGKGSVAAMMAGCLQLAGLRTGLYTSPHLCRFTERIQVSGREIPRQAVGRIVERVLDIDPELTFFEVATATAFIYFAEEKVDLALVETGLGGRLDATNVLTPQACILTHIGMDHTEVLGTDLASIALEKAGIIKPGVAVIAAPTNAEVESMLRARCAELSAPLYMLGWDYRKRTDSAGRLSFKGRSWTMDNVELSLAGRHQVENATLCLAALELLQEQGVAISKKQARRGLADVNWPGRMEQVGDILLDGAHNPSGFAALAEALDPAIERCLVLGMLGPADKAEAFSPLLPLVKRVIFTRPDSDRAVPPEDLAQRVPGSEVALDLTTAMAMVEDDPRAKLITGSLYLVGEARALLLGEPVDPRPVADPR